MPQEKLNKNTEYPATEKVQKGSCRSSRIKDFCVRLYGVLQKHPYQVLIWIAAAGMVLRLFVSWELLLNDPAVTNPPAETDMATYFALSDGILQGKFPETFYYQPFYYTLFLPFCRLFGSYGGCVATAILQSILGGITVFLAGRSAMRIAGLPGYSAVF